MWAWVCVGGATCAFNPWSWSATLLARPWMELPTAPCTHAWSAVVSADSATDAALVVRHWVAAAVA